MQPFEANSKPIILNTLPSLYYDYSSAAGAAAAIAFLFSTSTLRYWKKFQERFFMGQASVPSGLTVGLQLPLGLVPQTQRRAA